MAARTSTAPARGRAAAPAPAAPAARTGRTAAAPARQAPPAAAPTRRGTAAVAQAAPARQAPARGAPARQAPAPAAPAGRGRGRGGAAGGAGDVTSLLAGMKAAWNGSKDASESTGDFSINLPSDMYIAQLTDGKVFVFGKKQLALTLTFSVLEGDYTGETIPFFYEITNPDKLIWVQRDLRSIGSEVDSLEPEEIPAELEALLASPPEVRIFVKPPNADGFINAKIKGLVSADDGSGTAALNEPLEPADAGESQLDPGDQTGATDMGDPIEGDGIEWKQGRSKVTGVVDSVNINAGTVIATEDRSQQQVTLNIADITILPPQES